MKLGLDQFIKTLKCDSDLVWCHLMTIPAWIQCSSYLQRQSSNLTFAWRLLTWYNHITGKLVWASVQSNIVLVALSVFEGALKMWASVQSNIVLVALSVFEGAHKMSADHQDKKHHPRWYIILAFCYDLTAPQKHHKLSICRHDWPDEVADLRLHTIECGRVIHLHLVSAIHSYMVYICSICSRATYISPGPASQYGTAEVHCPCSRLLISW